MKEISLEERLSELEGTVKLLKSEMDDMLIKTYNKAVEENDIDLASDVLRKIRNKKLKESDKEFNLDRLDLNFNDVSGFIESLKVLINNEWGIYRQQLRDLPQQEGFPFNVTIPKHPLEENIQYLTLDEQSKKLIMKTNAN